MELEKYNEKNPSNVYEKFYGIPWKIPWNFPWKFMEFHGKFHELTERFSPGKHYTDNVNEKINDFVCYKQLAANCDSILFNPLLPLTSVSGPAFDKKYT
jgi:hypothetical protein